MSICIAHEHAFHPDRGRRLPYVLRELSVDILALNRSPAESVRDVASAYICADDSTPIRPRLKRFSARMLLARRQSAESKLGF
jgi:hypothetical protein